MKRLRFQPEQLAYEQGREDATRGFLDLMANSRGKLLSMMLDTEPYTSQRRMLAACIRLLEIYSRHYETWLQKAVVRPLSPNSDY